MNIGSIGSGTYQPIQRMPEASEVKGVLDKDGDSDDGVAAKAKPAPTVNTNGQAIGQLINTIA